MNERMFERTYAFFFIIVGFLGMIGANFFDNLPDAPDTIRGSSFLLTLLSFLLVLIGVRILYLLKLEKKILGQRSGQTLTDHQPANNDSKSIFREAAEERRKAFCDVGEKLKKSPDN